jgi:hypothetical protein
LHDETELPGGEATRYRFPIREEGLAMLQIAFDSESELVAPILAKEMVAEDWVGAERKITERHPQLTDSSILLMQAVRTCGKFDEKFTAGATGCLQSLAIRQSREWLDVGSLERLRTEAPRKREEQSKSSLMRL